MTDPEIQPEATTPESTEQSGASEAGEQKKRRVVVVGPDGQPIGEVEMTDDEIAEQEGSKSVTDLVEQPAKVMRIGTMVKQLLEEVRTAPLDAASRNRLKEIYSRSITELEDGLAPELQEELERLSLPFTYDAEPTDAELRIAQAQLVGWLEGLFHGIQTALFAQQMASRVALEQMRGGGAPQALPPGMMRPGQPGSGVPGQPEQHSSGQYL